MTELVEFDSALYQSKQLYSSDSLQTFLNWIELPCLLEAHRRFLDSPITVKELHQTASLLPNSKAPVDDGLPMEVYKQYGEVILLHLLKVFKAAIREHALPRSMTQANYILLIKPGKGSLDPGSYRPISLL